jgi:ubiquitin-protein ligase
MKKTTPLIHNHYSKRVHKDLQEFYLNVKNGSIKGIEITDIKDYQNIHFTIEGWGKHFKGFKFHGVLSIPLAYPYSAPKVTNFTWIPRYHVSNNWICLVIIYFKGLGYFRNTLFW